MEHVSGPAVSVIVPTRNERGNAGELIERLARALAGTPAELIFVDDSDDGTPEAIAALHAPIEIRVIHRQGRERSGGLSTAVLRGLSIARGEYVCIMDGDLQHPPEQVPALLARARERDLDVVIGSRHARGGSNTGLDGPWRRFVSWTFATVARLLFYEKLRRIRDPLSGFMLVRRAALDGVTMRPVGYKISLEILIRAAGSRVEEVPYAFTERGAGESKARIGTGLTFIRHALTLLIEVPEVGRFWKFGFVGASGVAVYMAVLWVLSGTLDLHTALAWGAAAEMAVLSNFFLNRNFTWFERRSEGPLQSALEAARYHGAAALSVGANGAAFFALTRVGVDTLTAGAVSVWVGVATSFLGAEKFVFTTRRRVAIRRAILPQPEEPDGDEPVATIEPPAGAHLASRKEHR